MEFKLTRKYIIVRFFILAFLLIGSNCTSSPPDVSITKPTVTPTPPLQQSSTPTIQPIRQLTPTNEPQVEDTATPAVKPQDNGDVITPVQKERLYQASLKYIATNEVDAIKIARGMNFVHNDGHPASMCGPLSIAILMDAGLMEKYMDLHEFWELNPRPGYNENTMKTFFPEDRYLWLTNSTPINKIDYKEFPLKAGDFIYLFAGNGGNFDHIITVSRVDSMGRAYSVSNLNTPSGYIISEVLLYDPNQPGTGMFYDWTNRKYKRLGLTGLGGFQLWRLKVPIKDKTPREIKLAENIDATLTKYGGKWNVLIKKIDGEVLYSRRAYEKIHPASAIKVPIAMLFFKALEENGVENYSEFLSQHGVDQRTFMDALHAMLVYSEEPATTSITNWTADQIHIDSVILGWGIKSTTFTPRRSTLIDLAKFYEGLYNGNLVSNAARETIFAFLEEYTPNDDTRLGVIRKYFSPQDHIFLKRGSIIINPLDVGDVAIITRGDEAYMVEIFGFQGKEETLTTFENLEKAIEEVAMVFWEYIQ